MVQPASLTVRGVLLQCVRNGTRRSSSICHWRPEFEPREPRAPCIVELCPFCARRSQCLGGLPLARSRSIRKPGPAATVDPPGRDSVLDWNAVALKTCDWDQHLRKSRAGRTHAKQPLPGDYPLGDLRRCQFGAARPQAVPGLPSRPGHSLERAVATAAHDTLVNLYPLQTDVFDAVAFRAVFRDRLALITL